MDSLIKELSEHKKPITVIGLGYVGLPLACLLATKYKVYGFDINPTRVAELKRGFDRTHEISERSQLANPNLTYTCEASCIKECPVVIVAVPTPIDNHKIPDLTPLVSASKVIGQNMAPGTIVVYESTVYPGLTENECRKVIETHSGMTYQKDFFLAYSPERVNPGDKEHTIDRIVKVVSASTPEALDVVDGLYASVITAGTHRAPSIAAAEAAKVIENTQRDINIALINELAYIFERIGLDTQDVLKAASTKWNFLPFKPGLVGGHCIGVDPYYLTHLAEGLGIHPQVILAGRKINDNMGKFVGEKMIKMVFSKRGETSGPPQIAVCGVTFKENVPDLRNTRVLDLVTTLEEFGARVHCLDPLCDPHEFEEEFGRSLSKWQDLPRCDGVIVAVPHSVYQSDLPLTQIAAKLTGARAFIDLKGIYSREEAQELGLNFWRL